MLRQRVVLCVLMAEMGFISFNKVVVEYLSFRKKKPRPKLNFIASDIIKTVSNILKDRVKTTRVANSKNLPI
jgi:hypothetical protein